MNKTTTNNLLFDLSGEHPELPMAELEAVLGALCKDFDIGDLEVINRLAFFETKDHSPGLIEKLANRLSMCRGIFEVAASRSNWQKVIRSSPRSDEIKKLDLVNQVKEIDRGVFERRKAQFRPYFAPISLHPRLARCLVNLAEPPEHGAVLDPFTGTGGILLEAGLMGFTVFGSDIDPRMVEGTIRNLEHWGLKEHSIFQAEIEELPGKITSKDRFVIVTEPPYGRATSIHGESLESLLERAFLVFNKILAPGGRLVISIPDKELVSLADKYFSTINMFELRVHRSLTKYICVFSRFD